MDEHRYFVARSSPGTGHRNTLALSIFRIVIYAPPETTDAADQRVLVLCGEAPIYLGCLRRVQHRVELLVHGLHAASLSPRDDNRIVRTTGVHEQQVTAALDEIRQVIEQSWQRPRLVAGDDYDGKPRC